jgi:hypothetical protein
MILQYMDSCFFDMLRRHNPTWNKLLTPLFQNLSFFDEPVERCELFCAEVCSQLYIDLLPWGQERWRRDFNRVLLRELPHVIGVKGSELEVALISDECLAKIVRPQCFQPGADFWPFKGSRREHVLVSAEILWKQLLFLPAHLDFKDLHLSQRLRFFERVRAMVPMEDLHSLLKNLLVEQSFYFIPGIFNEDQRWMGFF